MPHAAAACFSSTQGGAAHAAVAGERVCGGGEAGRQPAPSQLSKKGRHLPLAMLVPAPCLMLLPPAPHPPQGVKKIRLGPSLPAFLTPDAVQVRAWLTRGRGGWGSAGSGCVRLSSGILKRGARSAPPSPNRSLPHPNRPDARARPRVQVLVDKFQLQPADTSNPELDLVRRVCTGEVTWGEEAGEGCKPHATNGCKPHATPDHTTCHPRPPLTLLPLPFIPTPTPVARRRR
jgi:hypothetical protein